MGIRPKGIMIPKSAIFCPRKKKPTETLVSTYYLQKNQKKANKKTQLFSEGVYSYNPAKDDSGTSKEVHICAELMDS